MKVLFEKTYHGFEHFADYFRDVHEAADSDFNPVMKTIPGEFQGKIKVVITYQDAGEQVMNADGF